MNNVAIAAKYLLQHRGCGSVAILDIDYHHGNGSRWMFRLPFCGYEPTRESAQQIFYEEPRVLYVSLHAADDYPCEQFPQLGSAPL